MKSVSEWQKAGGVEVISDFILMNDYGDHNFIFLPVTSVINHTQLDHYHDKQVQFVLLLLLVVVVLICL